MEQQLNTFNKGMNKDVSPNKITPDTYTDALNIHTVTHDGGSTGAVVNEKGNSLEFTLPSTTEFDSGFKIIGTTSIKNIIVLFTKSDSNRLLIWKLVRNESTNSIENLTAYNTLTYTDHLAWEGTVGFGDDSIIKDSIVSYEGDSIIRLMWTDGESDLKSLNIADVAQSKDVSAADLSLYHSVLFNAPQITASSKTGSYTSGVVQYAYRLKKLYGHTTVFSPPTEMMHITEDMESGTSKNYGGTAAGEDTNKAFEVTLSSLDTDYDKVEVISLFYTSLTSTPVINIVADVDVPSSGTLTFVDDGLETKGTLTTAEYLKLVNTFGCKTLDTYRNKVLAANTYNDTDYFDIEFDARAYRSTTQRGPTQIHVYDKDGTSYELASNLFKVVKEETAAGVVTSPTPYALPLDHDAIQDYDHQETAIYSRSDTYTIGHIPYKTLGGSGPNVSWRFCMSAITIDTSYAEYDSDLSKSIYKISTSFATGNSHTRIDTGSINKSYQRDEMYRVGLVFHTKNGKKSFPKWVGDIRMPKILDTNTGPISGAPAYGADPYDTFHLIDHFGDHSSSSYGEHDIYANVLGIEFDIDLSSIDSSVRSEIARIEIVRAKRESRDRRIRFQGLLVGVENSVGTYTDEDYRRPVQLVDPFNTETLLYDDGGTAPQNTTSYLSGVTYTPTTGPATPLVTTGIKGLPTCCVISPEVNFFKNQEYVNGDTLSIEAAYVGVSEIIGTTTKQGVNKFTDRPVSTTGDEKFVRDDVEEIDVEDITVVGPNTTTSFRANGETFNFKNNSAWRRDNDAGNNFYEDLLGTTALIGVGTGFDLSSGTLVDQPMCGIANYKRELSNQYGGNNYGDRQNTTYISTGTFIEVYDEVEEYLEQQSFGGDTYIGMYDYLRTMVTPSAYALSTDSEGGHYQEVIYVPVETSINLQLRNDTNYAKVNDIDAAQLYSKLCETLELGVLLWGEDDYYSGVTDLYLYNAVYSRENDLVKMYPESLELASNAGSEVRIRVSQTKQNNELVDSWSQFLPEDYIEVDSNYGAINKILSWKDAVLFWQDSAIGSQQIDERAAIVDSTGASLVLGDGLTLGRYKYLTTNSGCINPFSVVTTNRAVYYYDALNYKLCTVSGQGSLELSTAKGMYSYFKNNVVGAIRSNGVDYLDGNRVLVVGTYDQLHNRLLFTFHDVTYTGGNYVPSTFTLGYNELVETFESFYSFTPEFYLNLNSMLFSADPSTNESMYKHNVGEYGEFYGTYYDSYITMLINKAPYVAKTFNNLLFNSIVTDTDGDVYDETFSKMQVWNEYQVTENVDLITNPSLVTNNIRRRFREWNTVIPRAYEDDKGNIIASQEARIRSHYAYLKLTYENSVLNNKQIKLEDVISKFNYSPTAY